MILLRRLLAGLIDFIFALSYTLSANIAASSLGVESSDAGVLSTIGYVFFIIYFGCLDSDFCGGGTIGKHLFGLEVINLQGQRLPLYLSIARTLIKIGLPFLLLKAGMNVLFMYARLGILTILVAVLVVPVSLIVGGGTFGIHDRLMGTYVVRNRSTGRPMPSWSRYLMNCGLAIMALALPLTAWVQSLGGLKQPNLGSLANQAEPSIQLANEILSGKGSEPFRPYVKHVTILPSVAEFPTDYSESYTKVPPEMIKQLRGNRGSASVIIELSRRGFSQNILKARYIDYLISTAGSRLVSPESLPTFIWVAFTVKSTFWPLELTEAQSCIAMVRLLPANPRKLEFQWAEPSNNRMIYVAVGAEGFLMTEKFR